MTEDSEEQLPPTQHVTVAAPTASLVMQAGIPKVWLSATFAPKWFSDARAEADRATDQDARRREILFAVTAAESYLFEWVRDEVLHGDFQRLNDYFVPGEKTPIADKWKDIPKQLKVAGLITDIPDLGGRSWEEFRTLVVFRNGLLHARASRPQTGGLPEKEMPAPSPDDLVRCRQDGRSAW